MSLTPADGTVALAAADDEAGGGAGGGGGGGAAMAAPAALLPCLIWWCMKRRKAMLAKRAEMAEQKRLAEERIAEEKRLAEEARVREEARLAEEKRKEEERVAREEAKRLRAWARKSSRNVQGAAALQDVTEEHKGGLKLSCTTREVTSQEHADLEAEMLMATKAVSRLPKLSEEARQVARNGGKIAFELDNHGNWVQVLKNGKAIPRARAMPAPAGMAEAAKLGKPQLPSTARGASSGMASARSLNKASSKRFPKMSPEAVAATQKGGQVEFELNEKGAWVEKISFPNDPEWVAQEAKRIKESELKMQNEKKKSMSSLASVALTAAAKNNATKDKAKPATKAKPNGPTPSPMKPPGDAAGKGAGAVSKDGDAAAGASPAPADGPWPSASGNTPAAAPSSEGASGETTESGAATDKLDVSAAEGTVSPEETARGNTPATADATSADDATTSKTTNATAARIATHDWSSQGVGGDEGGYLMLSKGDRIEVLTADDASGWWMGTLPSGSSGWFPVAYTEEAPAASPSRAKPDSPPKTPKTPETPKTPGSASSMASTSPSPGSFGGMSRRRRHWDALASNMPEVASLPRPSPEAIARAERGKRVEFVLAPDGESWHAVEVDEHGEQSTDTLAAELKGVNFQIGADGQMKAVGIDLKPEKKQEVRIKRKPTKAMVYPKPSEEALLAAQRGAKVGFELAPDGGSWVEKVSEEDAKGNFIPLNHLAMPAVARMPEPSPEVKAAAAAKALAAMLRREATDDGEQEVLTREKPGRQSRARGSIAKYGMEKEIVTTTEPKPAAPKFEKAQTLSNTKKPVVDKLRSAARMMFGGGGGGGGKKEKVEETPPPASVTPPKRSSPAAGGGGNFLPGVAAVAQAASAQAKLPRVEKCSSSPRQMVGGSPRTPRGGAVLRDEDGEPTPRARERVFL